MRVLLSTTKGTGHLLVLRPYFQELSKRGHSVRIAAPPLLTEKLKSLEYEQVVFDSPSNEALGVIWASMEGLSKLEIVKIAIRDAFGGLWAQAALPKLQQVMAEWQPDLILRESVELASAIAAEQAGIPHARVSVHNRGFEDLFISTATPSIDKLRQSIDLAPDAGASIRDPFVFTSFPPAMDGNGKLGPKPLRVRAPQHDTGISNDRPHWAPDDDRPFIYISFGTLVGGDPEGKNLYRAALKAMEGLPIKALLTTGGALDISELGSVPDNVSVETWVNEDIVFQWATAMLCHGGSGSTLGGLAAGLPMAIAPFHGDQPSNAENLVKSGAGCVVNDQSSHSLRRAIEQITSDDGMRINARKIADEIASMGSIENAVDKLLELVAQRNR
jgi:UDP:flavonoid glycosyltransferase YjiC (YdhE family)